jgi:predicted hydrolase (HD superfamily)
MGDTPRARHSQVVAALMDQLAGLFAQDAALWETVGLCHDLDFYAVGDDWGQHGLMTTDWLAGQLPSEALQAITAHDYRSGVLSDTLLADMLKAADATAILDQQLGRQGFQDIAVADSYPVLRHQVKERPYLSDILQEYGGKHGLSLAQIGALLSGAPAQA